MHGIVKQEMMTIIWVLLFIIKTTEPWFMVSLIGCVVFGVVMAWKFG